MYRSISLPKIKSFQLVSSLISSSFEECVGVRFDDSGYISKYCYCKSPQIPDRRSYVNMMRLAKFHQRISTPSLEPKVNQRGGRSGKSHPASCRPARSASIKDCTNRDRIFPFFPSKTQARSASIKDCTNRDIYFPLKIETQNVLPKI